METGAEAGILVTHGAKAFEEIVTGPCTLMRTWGTRRTWSGNEVPSQMAILNADQQHWSISLITNKDECSIHNSECVNQSGQSGRLISTAGVVEKISGK